MRFVAPLFRGRPAASSGNIYGNLREIHINLVQIVEIIGEDVEGDVGDDFGDVAIVETGGPGGTDVGVSNVSLGGDDFLGEGNSGAGFAVGGAAESGIVDGGIVEAGLFSENGVGGEAVLGAVRLCDGEGDGFAGLGIELAFAEGAAEFEIGVEDGRAVGHGAEDVQQHLFGFEVGHDGLGFGWGL